MDRMTDANGIAYVPYQRGNHVGYMIVHPKGRIEYLYFNPSADDSEGVSNVFVYRGAYADPALDEPQHFYTIERVV